MMEKLYFIKDIKKSNLPCNHFNGIKNYVATGDVENDTIVSFEEIDYETKPSRANICVSEGDVLFAKMQNTIKVIQIDSNNQNNIYSTGFYCFRDKRILPSFMKYYFLSKIFNEQKDKRCNGATMKAINDEGMSELFLPSFNIKKQEEIIFILDRIDTIIKNEKKQILLLDEFVKSRFIEMFGDLTLNSNNRKKVGDFAFVTKLAGFEFTKYIKYKDSGDIIMLRGLNCKNGKLVLDDIKWIDKEVSDMLPRSQLHKGDILMTYAGTIADVAIVPEDNKFHLAPNVAKICVENTKEVNPFFLVYLFMMTKDYILSFASTVAQPSINMEKIRNFEYSIPDIDKQNEFVSFANQVDELKANVLKRIALLNELLNKKMEEYFGDTE